ncbi:PREDICTED: uncharacterized protein LOC104715863 [Camelina sativa]|uniref:Uncharacterized protein LOC104715863 n=1 Tax=Camelina sativa TaxID=90675 RepID=A0ABM0TU99_CAMSA|nr:PREDICTED: uncharacterized protein LOC104715863 [Camelina sativa]
MKIIPLILIAFIILLSSFPAPIKVASRGAAGGGGRGGRRGGGYARGRGAAPAVIPKKQLPQECKEEVRDCIYGFIHGGVTYQLEYGAPCCVKLSKSLPCLCKFLKSNDSKESRAANAVLRSCRIDTTKCSTMPMPQACKPEVRHCVASHIYGGLGAPPHRGECCKKFENSKSCVCTLINSKDPHVSRHAGGVIRGCQFKVPNC